jgi:sugar/nucleoside kinase (ribokinase family)
MHKGAAELLATCEHRRAGGGDCTIHGSTAGTRREMSTASIAVKASAPGDGKVDCFCAGILVADHLCAPIDHLPSAGELVLADDLPLQIGGCAANAAIDLARLDVRVGILGCVGQDLFGQFVIETLSAQGINTRHVRRMAGVGTSGTLIVNVRGEDRRFIHTIGANGVLRAEDIPLDLVTQARVFYVGGYLLMPGLRQEGLAILFRQARESGVRTVLDVVMPDAQDHWRDIESLLAHTDVFLPNDDEAQALTGLADPLAQAERFLAAGAGAAVITCGEHGTLLAARESSGDTLRAKAGTYAVPFVGGTGAGDAFTAGYIAGMLQDLDPLGCLRWGSALGASCVRGIGATETVFRRQEAEEFLAQHELRIEHV